MSDSQSGRSASSISSVKQVQFGRPQLSNDSSDSTDTFEVSVHEYSVERIISDSNVNERLRHQLPETEYSRGQEDYFDELLSTVYKVVVQDALEQIVIIREVNQMSKKNVDLSYVPTYAKTADYDVDTIADPRVEYLQFKKFKKDVSWLEEILNKVVSDLEETDYFEGLKKILSDYALTKEEEKTILTSKEFNQREVPKLREYLDVERREMVRAIQKVTEKVGNLKDQLNDNLVEYEVKMKFIKEWEKSRHEQNVLTLRNKEEEYMTTISTKSDETDKELRVHDEMLSYLQTSLEEYQDDIERWMLKYDDDMESKDQQLQTMQIALENQRTAHEKLQSEFNLRQQKMEAYKTYKIQKKKEEEEQARTTRAATLIQAWWRGVMFRKGLGPFKRKKGKGKKK